MNGKLEHLVALLQVDRFAPLYWGRLVFYACLLVLLVFVLWLFVALRKARGPAERRPSAESASPAEGSPSSDERRAFLTKLEQEFEGLKGGRARDGTRGTAASQTFGASAPSAADSGESDLKAALGRAEADLQAINALLAEVSLDRDDMRQQRDDALRERDDWRALAEEWKAQAERLSLTLPATRAPAERLILTLPSSRPAPPRTPAAPPSRRSWWPWRRRAE